MHRHRQRAPRARRVQVMVHLGPAGERIVRLGLVAVRGQVLGQAGGEPGVDSDSVIPQEVERVIQEVGETLASEIRRSLEFFSATNQEGEISKLYICGGTSKISSLARIIEGKTGLPVESFDPFRNVKINERVFDINFIRNEAPKAAVAMGLALRRFDE